MARLVHVERDQVKAVCAAFEKHVAKDPALRKERKELERWIRAEKIRRDRQAASQSKARSIPQGAKK
jgi:hypothetical protein